jgi:hypothetical protein
MTSFNQAIGKICSGVLPDKHGLLDRWLVLEL